MSDVHTENTDKPAAVALTALRWGAVTVCAVSFTLAFFLVLPILQTITQGKERELGFMPIDTMQFEEPEPPPVEEEPEKEEEPDEPPPPELAPELPPLDLSQLEVAMNPGGGSGWGVTDFNVDLSNVIAKQEEVEQFFPGSDLDQKPRASYKVQPDMSAAMRRAGGGTVYVIFMVDEDGRVLNPKIQTSPSPVYDNAVIAAIKQWRFEPGKRNGKAVRFRTRQPFTFPRGKR